MCGGGGGGGGGVWGVLIAVGKLPTSCNFYNGIPRG